mmetsp:Transcript_9594/g.14166  ORF Transcript_9594/g.14166 Transcript_9594/m.14166 type:complete len:568 (-) Transcript_9594:29-1732(-)
MVNSEQLAINVDIADIRFGNKKLTRHVAGLNKDYLVVYGGRDFFNDSEPNGTLFIYNFETQKVNTIENENIFETVPIRSTSCMEDGIFYTYGGRNEVEKQLDALRAFPFSNDQIEKQKKEMAITSRFRKINDSYIPSWETIETGGTWEIPRQREGQAYAQHNGKLYIHSGLKDGEWVQGFWEYTMKTRMWAYIHPKSPLSEYVPAPRFCHAMTAANDKLYIFGGHAVGQDNLIYVFDLSKKEFEQPISVNPDYYPFGIADHSLVVIKHYIVILGGVRSMKSIPEITENPPPAVKRVISTYNMNTKEWVDNINIQFAEEKLNLSKGMYGQTAHVMGDQIWIIGGDCSYLADQDVMVLRSASWNDENLAAARLSYTPADLSVKKRKNVYPPPTPPFDSYIINHKMGVQLNKWYGELRQKWKLIYRATRDGWTSQNWHSKVDNKGATLTLLRHSNGSIFGGYTPIKWMSTGADKYDDHSWIFSLKNPHDNKSYKFPKIPNIRQRSVYHASGYGPWFGNNDIIIYSNPNTSTSSNAKLGKAYDYKLSHNAQSFFTGQNNFTLNEIETFVIS